MPAYNEEARHVGEHIAETVEFLKGRAYSWELILVDDGSTDRTLAVAEAAAGNGRNLRFFRNEVNRGKGYAVRRGVRAAAGKYILFTDADLSTPLDEIDRALPLLERFDVVAGSRRLPESRIIHRQPLRRRLMGRGFKLLSQLIAAPGATDAMCGFKGFTKPAAREIFSRQRLDGFAFDVEVLFIAKKLGLAVTEMPVAWHDSAGSRVRLAPEALAALADLLRIRWNSFKGFYE